MNIDEFVPAPDILWSPILPTEARWFLQDLLYHYRAILPTAHLWVDVGWDIVNFEWDLERKPPTLYVGEDWCEEPDEFWFVADLLRARYLANRQLLEREVVPVLLPSHPRADDWRNWAGTRQPPGAVYLPGSIVGQDEIEDFIHAEARKYVAARAGGSDSD